MICSGVPALIQGDVTPTPPFTIDSEVKAALESLPPFPAEVTDDIHARRQAAKTSREARGLELKPETRFTRADLEVPGLEAEPPVRVRLYRPTGSSRLPVVLYMHGGGFSLGDLDVEDGSCVRICREVGCLVVSVDYRLAPEHPYPAAVPDCYGALHWIARHHQALGAHPDRVAVAGGSAGGGLSAAVALLARDRRGPAIHCQLLIYPEIDDRSQNESSQYDGVPIFDGSAKKRSWRHYLGGLRDTVPIYAAPNRCDDLRGLPPAYILTAGLDPLRDEGLEYAARLIRDGVPESHHLPCVPHGWDIFAPNSVAAVRAWEERIAVLRRALRQDLSLGGGSPHD
jgi:acetyl esterase/lipase